MQSILVYPHAYEAPARHPVAGGVALEGVSDLSGEAWYRGPVILAWDDVLEEGRDPGAGHNVVFHEFAHQLDYLDGMSNGTPPLKDREQYRRWRQVMTAEFNRLREDDDLGRPTLLDPYGATNEAEFFAVATECFFDTPAAMARRHPRLYDLLREYYRQDPARRHPAGG